MFTDIEIAQQASMEPIVNIAKKINLTENDLELYGKYKAKISFEAIDRIEKENKNGKLVLVTAINPTPAGEGKTTTMIGLAQALNKIGKKSVVAMREPSLGPCFGVKGGAAGGGYSQVVPMEDINLHFTGDIHAITAANNLISAMLDNAIRQDNYLNIDLDNIVWKRCVDLNDRALREITIGQGPAANGVERKDGFNISVASEIMAILCLASSLDDLKERISKITLAYTKDGKPVTVADIKATGAATLLLKDAIKPNLVQTLEHTPVLVHGGPFANIAHGCNSVIATKLAMKLSDIALTEAGFGADLGAEKFFDIKCRQSGLKPDAVVLVATIRALKMHGGVAKTDLAIENLEALEKGFCNLQKHYENITEHYGVPCLVAINNFPTDTDAEFNLLYELCSKNSMQVVGSDIWARGGDGGIDMAEALVHLLETKESHFSCLYPDDISMMEKAFMVASCIYGANYLTWDEEVDKKLGQYTRLGLDKLPVCIAKTQYSLSDNPILLGAPRNFTITVRDIIPNTGAGFNVIVCGDIMRMPGLPKVPAAEKIDILNDGTIIGLF